MFLFVSQISFLFAIFKSFLSLFLPFFLLVSYDHASDFDFAISVVRVFVNGAFVGLFVNGFGRCCIDQAYRAP